MFREAAAGLGLVEEAVEVAAIHGARDEFARLGAHAEALEGVAPGLEPAQEVVGLAGPRAHAFGGNVEQVAGRGRLVGHAGAEAAGALDERHAPRAVRAEQVRRGERAAEAGPDDHGGERIGGGRGGRHAGTGFGDRGAGSAGLGKGLRRIPTFPGYGRAGRSGCIARGFFAATDQGEGRGGRGPSFPAACPGFRASGLLRA